MAIVVQALLPGPGVWIFDHFLLGKTMFPSNIQLRELFGVKVLEEFSGTSYCFFMHNSEFAALMSPSLFPQQLSLILVKMTWPD